MDEIKIEIKRQIIASIRKEHRVTTKVISGIVDIMQTKSETSNQMHKPYLILIEEAITNYTKKIKQIIDDQ